jgi:DNA-binding CsgD family transcriptional regulator
VGGFGVSVQPASAGRKRQVLAGLARGLGAAGIAVELGLSPLTVREYIKDVYEELGAHTSGQAVALGFAQGWIALGPDRLTVVSADALQDLLVTAAAVGRGNLRPCPVRARRALRGVRAGRDG